MIFAPGTVLVLTVALSLLSGVPVMTSRVIGDGRRHAAGAVLRRGLVYGRSDATASAPLENPVHPKDLLATMYHSIGLDPHTIVYNHLNQPREMVQGDVVPGILA